MTLEASWQGGCRNYHLLGCLFPMNFFPLHKLLGLGLCGTYPWFMTHDRHVIPTTTSSHVFASCRGYVGESGLCLRKRIQPVAATVRIFRVNAILGLAGPSESLGGSWKEFT